MTVAEHVDVFSDLKMLSPTSHSGAKVTDQSHDVESGASSALQGSGALTAGDKLLEDVGLLSRYKDTMAKDLSGGNKRKLCVALSLVANSRIVLMDEPTSGMDLTVRRKLWDVLKAHKKGRIIIITTHNMDEAELLADKIAIMKAGKIVNIGTPTDLKCSLGFTHKMTIRLNKELLRTVAAEEEQRNLDALTHYLKEHLDEDIHLRMPSNALSIKSVDKLEFTLEKSARCSFKRFFEKFDQAEVQEQFWIESHSLAACSIEDVFM